MLEVKDHVPASWKLSQSSRKHFLFSFSCNSWQLRQARSQPETFGGARVNYGGAKHFVYADEDKGRKFLYR